MCSHAAFTLLRCGTWELALAVICGSARLLSLWREEIHHIPPSHRDNGSPSPSVSAQSLFPSNQLIKSTQQAQSTELLLGSGHKNQEIHLQCALKQHLRYHHHATYTVFQGSLHSASKMASILYLLNCTFSLFD